MVIVRFFNWFRGLFLRNDFLTFDDRQGLKKIEKDAYVSKAEKLCKERGERKAEKDFGY